MGELAVLKMNVLPKMMYLYQSLHISLPESFFKFLNKTIRDYGLGGLRLPNFKMYYWAGQIRFISISIETEPALSWTQMEMFALNEEVGSNSIYKWIPKTISTKMSNPCTINLVRSWYEIRKLFGLKQDVTPKTPLWQNRLLPKC